MPDEKLKALFADHHLMTLATQKRNGRPQLSLVSYAYDAGRALIRVSITADRAKTANLRRDPRATAMVRSDDGWSYAVADADATLLPVCTDQDDDSVEELIDIYRAIQGEHPDWDEYRRAMVDDRRVPLHLRVTHLYGTIR